MKKIKLNFVRFLAALGPCLPVLFVSLQSSAGGYVGNGGDAVLCRTVETNPFSGYYSLDYLAQYQGENELITVNSLEDSLVRIENQLQKNIPELYESFKLFHSNLFNVADASQIHLWERAPFGLVDLKDEKLLTAIPENCLDSGRLSVVQAAIRVSPLVSGRPLGYYLYKYVPEVVVKLQQTNPLQVSFLIVHEWLWQYSDSVDRNRRVNYWLHSKVFQSNSRAESLKYLEGVGFVVPTLQPPFFSPASCVPDDEEYQHLIKFAENRLGFHNSFVLGYGRFFYRRQLCDSATSTCGKYDYFDSYSPLSHNYFGQSIYFELSDNKINLISRDSGSPAYQHFTCEIDFYQKKILECTEYLNSWGYPNEPTVKFNMTVGLGCFRFNAKYTQPQYGTVFNNHEQVIFVKTVTY